MSMPSYVLIGAFAILCALLSLQQLLDLPSNQCSMTYMPVPPQYIVSMKDQILLFEHTLMAILFHIFM